ncbi:hypothetical protein [Winogradskya humida]|uniref:ROS/MUCR transcriptional regulator protein n=1 Tax=Winogradskya humida TaxID=113566 RepID=A0ABQ3ZH29_9ACTN|nr:hypothetical protein [Actinoplanes humidus]GIE17895.1 hypothetical protein Ahu01nite_009970 [Actinoplanes humidus]
MSRHGHLWRLPDGTGLHAPPGELAVEESTGRLCCHLCGRWFTSLGSHVRAHGYTAQSYRAVMGARRERDLADRLARLGHAALEDYLRSAYAAGASLEALAAATGLGRARLRAALDRAGVALRPTGINSATGRRSRAVAAELRAAQRLGTEDLPGWLRQRRAAGWTLGRLAEAVGHSTHWVRWRLDAPLLSHGGELRRRW